MKRAGVGNEPDFKDNRPQPKPKGSLVGIIRRVEKPSIKGEVRWRSRPSSDTGMQGGGGCVALRGLSGGGCVALRGLSAGRGMQAGGGCVALRGLSAGRASRAAAAADVLAAAADADADNRPMYVDVDAEGYLVPAGARGTCGAAALIARARLAPGGAAGAALEPAAPGAWRLVVRAPAPPHAELLLWPRKEVLAQAGVPQLTAENKLGPNEYSCHRCDARFDAPNTLRVHLFLACRPPSAPLFLSALLQAAAAPLDLRSAFRPYTSVSSAACAAPAALEALATAWGRGAGGGAGHACVYCGRLYSRRYGLKIHLRTHTGYKPLRCPHCRRAFGDPSNLNKHVKLHGAARGGAHACALCGKLLVRRRDLERHMRARHAAHTPERDVSTTRTLIPME